MMENIHPGAEHAKSGAGSMWKIWVFDLVVHCCPCSDKINEATLYSADAETSYSYGLQTFRMRVHAW